MPSHRWLHAMAIPLFPILTPLSFASPFSFFDYQMRLSILHVGKGLPSCMEESCRYTTAKSQEGAEFFWPWEAITGERSISSHSSRYYYFFLFFHSFSFFLVFLFNLFKSSSNHEHRISRSRLANRNNRRYGNHGIITIGRTNWIGSIPLGMRWLCLFVNKTSGAEPLLIF